MATSRIPNQGRIRQLNIDDTSGEIWASKNIDLFTSPDKIKLARPMRQIANNSDVGGLAPLAFVVHENVIKVLTATDLYKFDSNLTSIDSDTTSPTNADDAVIFRGQVVISEITTVDAWDGTTYVSDWWASRSNPALTSGNYHLMEVSNIGAETLVVADGSKVHSYTGEIASGAVDSFTVDLGTSFYATTLKATSRRVYIGTYSNDGGEARVFDWDSASSNYNQSYPTGAKAVLAMEEIDGVPLIITEKGEIKIFNNAGFVTVAQFPFASKPEFDSSLKVDQVNTEPRFRPIHAKGMKRVGNNVFININFINEDNGIQMDERSPNGIWALDLKTFSLNHVSTTNGDSAYGESSPLLSLNSGLGRIYTGVRDFTTNARSIVVEDLVSTTANEGYLITPQINSNTVKDVYKEIVAQAFMDTGDTLDVKYRNESVPDYPITDIGGSWLETTVFNTTSDLSEAYSRFVSGKLDEMEVLIGSGAGKSVQIVSIEQGTSTYSVTVDQECGIIGETSIVRIDNWYGVGKTMTIDDKETVRFGTGGTGSWGQFKLIVKGKKGLPEIRQILIKTNPKEEL